MPDTAERRRRLVVGNWKMNGDLATNARLLEQITRQWPSLSETDVAICPPFAYLPQVADALADTPIRWGGQSVNPNTSGAYTGEIAAEMLADLGCHYVIVGHNERRRLLCESDDYVAAQFIAAQRAGLTPILCVGESLEQRQAQRALDTIGAQLDVVIEAAGREAFKKAIVAYEPIWAVGTGQTATPEEAEEVHAYIRERFGDLGPRLTILYGGSVKAHNADELFALADIDGALLGGAALKADEFLAICQSGEWAKR